MGFLPVDACDALDETVVEGSGEDTGNQQCTSMKIELCLRGSVNPDR